MIITSRTAALAEPRVTGGGGSAKGSTSRRCHYEFSDPFGERLVKTGYVPCTQTLSHGRVIAGARLGGLHHRYDRAACYRPSKAGCVLDLNGRSSFESVHCARPLRSKCLCRSL